ncbi:MAG: hypothetical protein Q9202_001357 [Teloschistes flavicans]
MADNANARKRAIDTVDLTGDDDTQPSSKAPRSTSPLPSSPVPVQPSQTQPTGSQPLQSQSHSWIEDEANNTIMVPQETDEGPDFEQWELYGTMRTKIVGVQYYNGYATNGEYVSVAREPTNQFDPNAIKISNVMRQQIGHIARLDAAKLAPFMDANELLVEGRLSGVKGPYDCPATVKLYGPSNPNVKSFLAHRMREKRLPIDGFVARRQDARMKHIEVSRRLQEAQGPATWTTSAATSSRQQPSGSQPLRGSLRGQQPVVQSMDNIIETSQRISPREIGEVVEKFGTGEEVLSKMAMADQPARLATRMLPYQRQALQWLLEHENPQLPPVGSTDPVQLWKRHSLDPKSFTNMATHYSIGTQPTLASGGILADDMGLGKTLEMISLMVSDPLKKGATLIVSPLGIMSNWSDQIARHVQPDEPLKVFMYHGQSKKQSVNAEMLAEYDVVITTYGTLSTEYVPEGRSEEANSPSSNLFSVKWRRVILDEGHQIRNPNSKGSIACANLTAHSRWVLTGTPIINTLKDLYSLVRFLGLTGGLERQEIFNSVLMRPLNAGSEEASHILQALMQATCLRRKKDMSFIDLRIPELTEYIHRVEFFPHEREKYEALEAEAKGLLRDARLRDRTLGNGGQMYRHLLEVLLRLRQVCNHWKLCGERITTLLAALEKQDCVDMTPENKKALQAMLQLNIESHEDCVVCLEPLHDPVITACAHTFGRSCIERVIQTQHRCPMCRAALDMEKLVAPAVHLGESAPGDVDIDTSSSKIEALIKIVQASRQKEGNKVVIFSQWTSFLNTVQRQLDARGWKYSRIDGSMRADARDKAMTMLGEDPECRIMLASLAVCSVGLNLVAANHVIMADSWWAPSIEDQAVDRVHRLGQTKPTTVWRLVVDDTIEDRVLDIQSEKRKLMMAAFREKEGKRDGKQARLGDIERLLA